jgi:hypothetical protein
MSVVNGTSWSQVDFVQGSEHRLSSWKKLRRELTRDLSDQDWLEKIVDFWSLAPLKPRVLDYSQLGTWPNPWQLLDQGDFDENSVSLGMFYTCALSQDSRWQPHDLELLLLRDTQQHQEQLAVCIANTWLIGWEYRKIKSWQPPRNNVILQNRWRCDLEKYLPVPV